METVRLTGCGTIKAVRYGNVKAGDVLVYAWDDRYTVTAVEDAGPRSVWVTAVSHRSGTSYRNRRRRDAKIGHGN